MIGIFDSAIGGLTVVREIRRAFPGVDLVFLADTARSPYADRSMETVARFADAAIGRLTALDPEILVVCCSATAASLRLGHIGPYALPTVDQVTSGVGAAVSVSKNHRFGVIGNRAAVKSGIYERLIQERIPGARVYTRPSTLLDTLIEEGWAKRPETTRIAKKLLHPLRVRQIDTLILDSPYLSEIEKKLLLKAGKRVHVVRPWRVLPRALGDLLARTPDRGRGCETGGALKVQVTDITEGLKERCEAFLKSRVILESVSTGVEGRA